MLTAGVGHGRKGHEMSDGIIVARHDFPVIELAPVTVDFSQTIEQMVAGLANTNPGITSAHFPDCRDGREGREEAALVLAKPLHDREHMPRDVVLARLEGTGFQPAGLPYLAALKPHADELLAAGVHYLNAGAANSIWPGPDGGYAVYFLLNAEDRGFELHWLEGDWGGQVWWLCHRAP